jgi:hypothetical protein
VEWFPTVRGAERIDLTKEPGPPGITALMIGDGGRVWTAFAFSRRPYDPPVVRNSEGIAVFDPDLWRARLDTRMEVIDPYRGTVLAEQLFEGLVYGSDVFPFAYTVRKDRNGDEFIEVVRVALLER